MDLDQWASAQAGRRVESLGQLSCGQYACVLIRSMDDGGDIFDTHVVGVGKSEQTAIGAALKLATTARHERTSCVFISTCKLNCGFSG